MGPILVLLNVLEVVPQHPGDHGILGALILVSYMEVSGLVQDT